MEFTGERMIPGKVDYELELEHVLRYNFAAQFVNEGMILDAACGAGYGTRILSKDFNKVIGIDISEEAIQYAKDTYAAENISFVVSSVEKLEFSDSMFDAVVSFETLEHLNEESQIMFLREIKRVLKPDGKLIISTPNHDVYALRGENEFHIKELTLDEFRTFLEKYFKNVVIMGQQFEITGIISDQDTLSDSVNAGLDIDKAEYLIAVCSDIKLDKIKSYTIPRKDGKYKELLSWSISLHQENIKKNKRIEEQTLELQVKQKLMEDRRNELQVKQKLIEEQELNINNKQQLIEQLKQEIINKEGHIELLLRSERELNRIMSSRSWRYLTYAWRIRDLLVPKDSKRRILVKLGVKFIKSPKKFIKKCTPARIGKFFYYIKRESISGTSRRLDECLFEPALKQIHVITNDVEKIRTLNEYDSLIFTNVKEPKVSIIIPVYNQFNYTYECLKSIYKRTNNVSYEIIIADDCSTDLTKDILKLVKNIKVVKTESNMRFLKNCNNAAKYANGEYILFLNNDTQVQENWLLSLLELIESDDKIGMVGSKLVYPDGRLQEAGGIIWNDASGWNYGRLSDPNEPEFNYVKEVDYISGAVIMIRRKLWEEIGGFDERFAPAYYEDTDLAFEVRRQGYKVVFQPKSIVVHFEGISNGTDLTSGQKQYQVVNQQKFYEKWSAVLEKEHYENAHNVFLARDRSRGKKTVLVIDHYIPTFDKDAGSRTTYQYIKLLIDMGCNVKLIGDNYYKNEPYATYFEQLGVEILYGSYYASHWREWIKENSAYISHVFLNRPHISVKYIDFIKSQTNAKIVYYGHDLHFIRERREYDISGDKALLDSSEKWKQQEFDIMKKADVVFTLSKDEQEIINKEFGFGKAVISPIFYYNTFKYPLKDIKKNSDIIFVGGFNHRPNEDGVIWFIQNIWNKVHDNIPEARFVIIGSNPTDKVKQMASDSIIVTGFISDEALVDYYTHCRLCVIPLRYGAGVKGKTIEAMYYGAGIISTSIGVEGLPDIEQYIQVADDEDEFAEKVIALYNNDQKREEETIQYKEYLKRHFSYEKARELFEKTFN